CICVYCFIDLFFFSSRRRHTSSKRDWSSDVCSSDLFEDHNHVSGGDHTQHPEFAIARWAANNLTPEERAKATVYTSGEHCPMCRSEERRVGKECGGWLRP